MLFSLKGLLEVINEASIKEALFNFKCTKNADVQNFLRYEAVEMEKKFQTGTYLIADDEKLKDNIFEITGYFSIALKVFKFENTLSKRARKRLSGKSDDYVPAFLIGQLAKCDNASKGTGAEYLKMAISKIKEIQYLIGGCLVYLDCKDDLVTYYENQGFKCIQKNPDDDQLNQMYIVV